MAILKWQKGNNEWVQLYGSALRNRLRRDKNLSDLTNATEAKKNIGLYGDVPDHHHDSRYMPILSRIEGKVDTEISDRKADAKSMENTLRTMAEAEVSAAIQGFGVSIAQEASERKREDNNILKQHEEDKLTLEKEIAKEGTERQTDKAEVISRINIERNDRSIAVMQEQKDRDAAIKEAMAELREDDARITEAIKQEVADRNTAIDAKATELVGKILQEANDRNRAIEEARKALLAAINNEAAIRIANKSELDSRIDTLEKLLNQRYSDAEDTINRYFSRFYIGKNPPENPEADKTIWFNITDGTEEIRIYKNGKWTLFGAGYL